MLRNDYRRALIMFRSLEQGFSGHGAPGAANIDGTLCLTACAPGALALRAALVGRRGNDYFAAPLGTLRRDSRGQYSLIASFDPRNIEGRELEEYQLLVVVDAGDPCHLVLSGNVCGSVQMDWERVRRAACALFLPGANARAGRSAEGQPLPAAEPSPDNAYADAPAAEPSPDNAYADAPAAEPFPDNAYADAPAAEPPSDNAFADVPAAEPPSDNAYADAPAVEPSPDNAYADAPAVEPSPDNAYADAPAVEPSPDNAYADAPAAEPPSDNVYADAPAAEPPSDIGFADAPAVEPPSDNACADVPAAEPSSDSAYADAPAVEPSSDAPPAATPAEERTLDLSRPWPQPFEAVRALFSGGEWMEEPPLAGYAFVRAPLTDSSAAPWVAVGVRAEDGVPAQVVYAFPADEGGTPPAGLEDCIRFSGARDWWLRFEPAQDAP